MKIMKRIFAALFAAAILCSLGITAFAENGDTVTRDGVNYLESYEIVPQKKCYIVIESPDAAGDVVILDEIDGIPVRKIEKDAFFNNRRITSVTIGSNVTEIGNGAFSCCRSLQRVTFGKSVSKIGYASFESTEITSVELGNAITQIESNAFASCRKLETVRLGIGLSRIYENAFYNCESLRTIALPDDMTLNLNGIPDDVEFLPISGDIREEVEELWNLYYELDDEMKDVKNQIDNDRKFLNRIDGTASVFGQGNVTLIIIGAVLIVAALVVGLLIGKKLPAKKKNT